MKRFATLFCALALAAPVFAAVNDSVVTFSTKGPDTYGDGATVLDGEYYALVWVKDGATFAGFNADGTVVDPDTSASLIAVPCAKDGHCPTICYQISAALVEQYTGGSFSVWLLDTRIADGLGGTKVGGIAKTVNGYGQVGSSLAAGSGIAGSTDAGAVTVTDLSTLPADMPKPVIKAMEIVDGYVYITVEGTVPYLQYNVAASVEPAVADGEEVDVPQTGDVDQDILLIAPADGDSGFFRVQGSRQ